MLLQAREAIKAKEEREKKEKEERAKKAESEDKESALLKKKAEERYAFCVWFSALYSFFLFPPFFLCVLWDGVY